MVVIIIMMMMMMMMMNMITQREINVQNSYLCQFMFNSGVPIATMSLLLLLECPFWTPNLTLPVIEL